MLTLNDGRNELWQWDTGRKITVETDCSQVHFSNKVFGRSIDVDVVDGVAAIPDILLQTDKELTAWAFVGTAENGYTKISKVFKVNKRNKPADYVFTSTEQTTLGEILERLDYIESAQDPDAIKNAVEDYLDENPIHIEETDPTVPAWAKQPMKPQYTAAEVGALPDTYAPPAAPVRSVNGKAGAVNLTAEDVGALPDDTQIPTVPDWVKPIPAAVGQYFGVSAVDGNGNVTAVEAVDMPSGGETWEFVRYFKIPSVDELPTDNSGVTWIADDSNNVYGFEFDTNELGEKFAYNKLFIKARQGGSASSNKSASIYVNDVNIGDWATAQVNLMNRVGKVKIERYGYGYEMSYFGMCASSVSGTWTSPATNNNGNAYANGEYNRIDEPIQKIKFVCSPENYFSSDYLVGVWGAK